MAAKQPKADERPEDAALDALARALAPRVLEIIREQARERDEADALAEVLAGTDFEVAS